MMTSRRLSAACARAAEAIRTNAASSDRLARESERDIGGGLYDEWMSACTACKARTAQYRACRFATPEPWRSRASFPGRWRADCNATRNQNVDLNCTPQVRGSLMKPVSLLKSIAPVTRI